MPPAARVTDLHTCPMAPPPGLPIIPPCAITVLIGMMPAARMGDLCACIGPPPAPVDAIAFGSPTVLIQGMPAARMGDPTVKGGVITTGFPTVLIGLSGVAAPPAPDAPAGIKAFIKSMVSKAKALVAPSAKTGGDAPGKALEDAAGNVNPLGGGDNCGHIIDAVLARLRGTDPDATAPDERDGSWDEIENRFNTTIDWGSDFDAAYTAVTDGGDGTVAIVGIGYSTGDSHVVILANDGGKVGIVEGQDWGPDQPAEVVWTPEAANDRYNADGGSTIGWGLVP